MGLEALARRIWRCNGPVADLILLPLALLAKLYGAIVARRRQRYLSGAKARAALPVPVISIGNLEAGGAGKTPFTITLAKGLMGLDCSVAILTRGYGGSNEGGPPLVVSDGVTVHATPAQAGDEAVLLANALPGVPVVACADRALGGRILLDFATPDVVLLDDGFQHLKLIRDADVVLLDGQAPLANGHLLPRGPLREGPEGLSRADLLVAREASVAHLPVLMSALSAHTAAPWLAAQTAVTRLYDGCGEAVTVPPDGRVLALCGIARPERFWATLEGLGLTLAGRVAMPDHHRYTAANLASLADQARRSGVRAVVTTEKDWVKLAAIWPDNLPVWVVAIQLELSDPGQPWLSTLLEGARKRFAQRTSTAQSGGEA